MVIIREAKIHEVAADIYMFDIPIPQPALKTVHSYFIKGDNRTDRNLLVDTAWNTPECYAAMRYCLNKLGVDMNLTDIFLTHYHIDHVGLIEPLKTDQNQIFISGEDKLSLESPHATETLGAKFALSSGLPMGVLMELYEMRQKNGFQESKQVETTIIESGQVFNIGRYKLICIKTPGHSKGHMCLYDANQGVLFTGDHVMNKISPVISSMSYEGDTLGDHVANMEKLLELEVPLALPGHMGVMDNFHSRTRELIEHYRERRKNVLSALDGEALPAYEVAKRMKWDRSIPFEDFEALDIWLATGEASAYLEHLLNLGVLKMNSIKGDELSGIVKDKAPKTELTLFSLTSSD